MLMTICLKKHKEEHCKCQLAEIYRQKAKISTITPNQSIELYKKAAELGSVKANIELGKKNYSEALKYLHLTPDVTGVLKAFESLINTHKSEIISKIQQGGIEDITKLSLVLTEAYLEQAKYFKNKGLTKLAGDAQELTRIAFFDIITATITIDEYNNNILT